MFEIKTSVIIMLSMVALIILATSISLSADQGNMNPETVLVEYTGGVITKADFDEEFEKIPHMYRSRYNTVESRKNLLNSIVIATIFEIKALELGVDQRPDVIDNIEKGLVNHYAMEYRKRDITDKVEIDRSDIQDYYDEHENRFTESANSTIRHIMTEDESEAQRAKKLLLAGEDFNDVMNRFSVNNFSKRHQGIIRNIRGNDYIPGVGKDESFDQEITNAPLNAWQGPVFSEDHYHLFMVTERKPRRLKPLDEVREEIVNRLRPAKEYELKNIRVSELKEKYNVNINNDILTSVNFGDDLGTTDQENPVIVDSNVEELVMTVDDFRLRLRQLSPQEKSQMDNPQQLNNLLDNMLENRLFSYEAKQKGYTEFVMDNEEAEQIRRNTILNTLFKDLVIEQSEPTREQIAAHYEENLDSYTTKEQRTAQIFAYDSQREAKRARKAVAKAIKSDDEITLEEIVQESLFSDNNGVVSNITRDSNIPGIGKDEKIHEAIWNTKNDALSKIEQSDSDQYFFLRVIEDNPAYTLPLAQAEEKIVFQLTRQNHEQRWNELQEELKREYNVNIHDDRIVVMQTAKELFSLAEEAQKRNRHTEALGYYDQIVENYRNNDDDYKALFMKAFLLAEDMNRTDEAVTLFRKILADYPYSDLHESAEFMIKSIEEGFDVFDD